MPGDVIRDADAIIKEAALQSVTAKYPEIDTSVLKFGGINIQPMQDGSEAIFIGYVLSDSYPVGIEAERWGRDYGRRSEHQWQYQRAVCKRACQKDQRFFEMTIAEKWVEPNRGPAWRPTTFTGNSDTVALARARFQGRSLYANLHRQHSVKGSRETFTAILLNQKELS
jgi:hypothetical protein